MARVVVGMSGGVDSSVAAYLLQQAGHEVIGVTMQIWQQEENQMQEENGGCCGLSAVEDARRTAAMLGIPYYVMNFRKEFKEAVIDYFVDEYRQGRTPNPCIACNRYVKWESLYGRARQIGADYIATGHYSRIVKLPNGRFTLRVSATDAKDQTYALYNLTQEQLAHTLMPVGDYSKEDIRKMAKEIGLLVADKPDSMEICFVPDGDYAGFIERYTETAFAPGHFVNTAGEVLGTHRGIIHYTVGQRKGLGIAFGIPMFVKELRPETNEVVLASDAELFSDVLYADRLNFMSIEGLTGTMHVRAKIRYSHKGAEADISMAGDDMVCCRFLEPQRAITPGQAVVFYDGDLVVAGGTIVGTSR